MEHNAGPIGKRNRHRAHLRRLLVTTAVVAGAVTATAAPFADASEFSFTFTVDAGGVPGNIGVDAIYSGVGGGQYDILPCDSDPQVRQLRWTEDGRVVGTTSLPQTRDGRPLTQVRLELYPLHIEVKLDSASPSFIDFGRVTMPMAGSPGVFAPTGNVVSATPVPDGRVSIDAFQVPTVFPDPPAPLQTNGIVEWGAFSTGDNIGTRWTAGLGWAGRYGLFITDNATGRRAHVLSDITPGSIPAIDLDAICFGFEICSFSGSSPNAPGTFTPVTPIRILDTRRNLGITNAQQFCQVIDFVNRCGVATGGGEESAVNPLTRRAVAANHTLKVTGIAGVPESGVSAVLLNVTATGAPGPGFISVIPPGPRGDYGRLEIFDDQGWFNRRGTPQTSNLNVNGPAAVPNLVLARVGAGGTISLFNSFGPTEVIADLAGWFDTSGSAPSTSGFIGLESPERVFDTRTAIGTVQSPLRNGEVRTVDLSNLSGIAPGADSVVVNLTVTSPNAAGFVTAFPSGGLPPEASNLNFVAGDTRANLAVVALRDGRIDLTIGAADGLSAEVIVDVLGSFATGGSLVTAVDPVRVIDSRNGIGTAQTRFGPAEARTIAVAGVAGIPSDATGVIANITGTGSTSPFTYLTAWPTGARPATSNVNINLSTGSTVPNLIMLNLGPEGAFQLANEFGEIDVIVDVMGYLR
jgi:hypothetical protein